MSDEALSMEEPKRKLAKLEEMLPDASEMVHEFGRFLASYLNPQLLPIGFLMGCQLAIYDLQAGVNGFRGTKIHSSLVGHLPVMYAMLRMEIPRIADAVFPAEFAANVKKLYEETKARE